MAKTSARGKAPRTDRLAPPENLNIDLTTFKPDLSSNDLKNLLTPVKLANVGLFIFPTIETISPVKTVGLGRTNLTLVRPEVFQTDSIPPFVSFDPAIGSAQQRPTVSVHLEPGKYGLAGNTTFVMSFSVEAFGNVTFTVGSNVTGGNSNGLGSRTVNGKQVLSIVFNNTALTPQIFGHIAQTGGGRWQWFQTRISYLPLLISA